MKQRLTYLLRDPKEFSLSQVRVTTESTSVEALDAAKEQHLTFGFDELPQEVNSLMHVHPIFVLT